MNKLQSIETFMAQKTLAIAGISRNPRKFGNAVYKELKKKGYQLVPVHPVMEKYEGQPCYPTLQSVPGTLDGVVICTSPGQTGKIIRDGISLGINNFWVQQGAESPESLELAKDPNLNIIHKHCILMFAEPLAFFHKPHRFFLKLFGKFPS